ncbi:glycosyltransferase family 4 protein [Haliangium sp.]|uniref:glycosyltransferase family 4 protein n=1 Tax=Haliangium sp. TaxID=2663208 RepID=UPI003D135DB2
MSRFKRKLAQIKHHTAAGSHLANVAADHDAVRNLFQHGAQGKVVYLDVTRTMRRDRGWHTGITRVEFRYIRHFFDYSDAPVFFVAQTRGERFELVSRRRLARHLARLRWIDDVTELTGPDPAANHRRGGLSATRRLAHAYADALVPARRRAPLPPGVYLNVSHAGIDRAELLRTLRDIMGMTIAIYVHDLIPIDFPEYSGNEDPDRHRDRMLNVLEFADLVLTNSEATRDRLAAFASSSGRPLPPTHVAVIGVEEDFLAAAAGAVARPGTQRPYFLYVSTIQPRKNHQLLLALWRRLAAERGDRAFDLVLVGRRGWLSEGVFRFVEHSDVGRKYVREHNDLADSALARLYQGATALLFPSLAEGWGMPIAEAQAFGQPVIASNLPVFREASQGLATLIDPIDGMQWYETICRYVDDPPCRERHAERVRSRYRPPTWAAHMSRVDELLSARVRTRSRCM